MDEGTLSRGNPPYIEYVLELHCEFADNLLTEPGQFLIGLISFGMRLSPYTWISVSRIQSILACRIIQHHILTQATPVYSVPMLIPITIFSPNIVGMLMNVEDILQIQK